MNRKKLYAALTAAACFTTTFASMPQLMTATQAAEVTYDSFDISYDGWHGTDPANNIVPVEGAGIGGTRCMSMTNRKDASEGAQSTKGLYLFGGVKYNYSINVYSETDETFHLTLRYVDMNNTEKSTTIELASVNVKAGEWTEIANSFKAPKDTCEYELTLTTDSTNDFLFDDFTITAKKSTADALAAQSDKSLKDEFANYFRVGNILNRGTVQNSGITGNFLKDYNAVECENETKPDATLVQNGSTDTNIKVSLNSCAAICDFAQKNGLGFRGHTLVWHSQSPEWFFKSNGNWCSKQQQEQRLESYIKNMFNAYATQYPNLDLYAYDVCNEIINDGTANQGGVRPTSGNGSSKWVSVYGNNSFVELAFKYARQYAPDGCKLYYNDYNEFANDKQNCIINTILKPLKQKGYLDGMGMQSHISAAATNAWGSTDSYLAAMDKYLNLGIDVQVTELDISVENGKFSNNDQATKYAAIFQHAVDWNKKHKDGPNVTLIQIWGPNDANSWLSSGSNALLYDRNNQPKAAYTKLQSLLPTSEWGVGIPYTGPGSGKSSSYTPPEPPKADERGYWFESTFEEGTDSWSGRGGASVEKASGGYDSNNALYVSGRTNAWNGASYELDYQAFKAGEAYSFSVNAMSKTGDTTGFKFSLQYTDSSGETQYDEIASGVAPAGEWIQLANTSYTLPAGGSSFVIYVETNDESTNDFYVDYAVGAVKGTKIPGAGTPDVPQPVVKTKILGDVDFDGKITAFDLVGARQVVLGTLKDSQAKTNADVDQSGAAEVNDLVLLNEFVLGKRTKFPEPEKPPVPTLDPSKYESKFSGVTLAASFKKEGENNPLYTQRFGADPGWMVYDGRLYVYTTADEFEYKNGQLVENAYSSGYINCLSSADLVNWTDHGQIPVAKTRVNGTPIARWANNAWAPDAAWKKINGQDKFFLYFANNGSGIGVITADDPTFTKNVKDPLGKELISRNTPNSNVVWLFDPGVYYDPDSNIAMMAYGGGVPNGQAAQTKQGRIVQLGDDMISIKGTPFDPGTPYLFEDSSMLKIGDTWYYSFCHNWNVPGGASVNGNSFASADIGYMTSKNPLGSYQYQGVVFKNTGTQRLDKGGNNHHSVIEFKGSYYVLYHSRRLEMNMGVNGGNGLNYRSPCIDKATLSNGKITCNGSQKGVSQVENLDPYKKVQAETMSNQSKNISISGIGDTKVKVKKGDWIKVSGVDLSKGVSSITVKGSGNATVKFCAGSTTGTVLGYGELNGSENTLAATDNNVTGVKDIYMIFSGDCEFDYWQFA